MLSTGVAVVGVAGVAAMAWATNATPGARTIMPSVLVALGVFCVVLAACASPLVSTSRRTVLLSLAAALSGVVVAYVPAKAVEARVRQDEAELTNRAHRLLQEQGSGHVVVTAGGDPVRGLIFICAGATTEITGMCLRHLYGPWWEYAGLSEKPGCPVGFDFRPVT